MVLHWRLYGIGFFGGVFFGFWVFWFFFFGKSLEIFVNVSQLTLCTSHAAAHNPKFCVEYIWWISPHLTWRGSLRYS